MNIRSIKDGRMEGWKDENKISKGWKDGRMNIRSSKG